VLLGLLLVIYGPSTRGGFLAYDDSWMIEENAFFKDAHFSSLAPIWFDLSKSTRLLLGAEYLPLRDSTVLLDVLLFGFSPQAMRLHNLVWYLLAGYFCVRAVRAALGENYASDFLAAFFLLHPVHAESVAWIIGRKDVMGLAFFWLALWTHVTERPGWRWCTAVFLAFAQLSKFLFIAAPLLFLCMDVLRSRLPSWRKALVAYGVPSMVCLSIALIQFNVARHTTMVEGEGAALSTRVVTMGPVWLAYLLSSFAGLGLNVMHETRVTNSISFSAVLGYLCLGCWLATAWVRSLRGRDARPAARVAWFLIPLLPASHLLVPIQNFHEDRYLLLSVMGAGLCYQELGRSLLARTLWSRAQRLVRLLAGGLLAYLALLSAERAYLFADAIRLFSHATESTHESSKAPYQLGIAHEGRAQTDLALRAYHLAIARSSDEFARRATNNLARIYARRGNYAQAEHYLRRGVALWPSEAKLQSNLAEVLWLSGRRSEARMLYEQVLTQFPDHQRSREKYQEHFSPAR
jgi:hypothetical protein